MRKVSLVVAALVLTSCGKVADLQPKTGHSLPPKPAMAKTTPDAEALLQLPTQAAPQRVDELLKKGETRKPDRFALPPPSGSEDEPAPPPTEPDTQGEPK